MKYNKKTKKKERRQMLHLRESHYIKLTFENHVYGVYFENISFSH